MIVALLPHKETRKVLKEIIHSILGFLYPSHCVDHEHRKETERNRKQNSIRKQNETKKVLKRVLKKYLLQRKQMDTIETAGQYKGW